MDSGTDSPTVHPCAVRLTELRLAVFVDFGGKRELESPLIVTTRELPTEEVRQPDLFDILGPRSLVFNKAPPIGTAAARDYVVLDVYQLGSLLPNLLSGRDEQSGGGGGGGGGGG